MFEFKQFLRAPDYLPWLAYDEESELFWLDGNYVGFTISAIPLAGFEPAMEKRFQSLLTGDYPVGAYLQFNLMVFDDVSEHVAGLRRARAGTRNPLIVEATANTINYIRKGAAGGIPDIPVRNSTLLISMKIPTEMMSPSQEEAENAVRLRREVLETLATIGFRDLRVLNDTELLYQLSIIMNRSQVAAWRKGRTPVDESRWLRNQVLDYDTTMTINEKTLRLGDTFISSLSPKRVPQFSYFGLAEKFSVDPHSGDRGIPCAHMISCTVKIEDISDMKPKLERKRQYNGNYADGPFGRLKPEYKQRFSDLTLVTKMIEEGQQIHRYSLNVLLFSPTEEDARRNTSTTRTYLNELGFAMMEDAGVTFQMLRSNLPLGPEKEDQANLDRLKMMNSNGIATFVPVFFEWRGTPTPLISLTGRGGQVMGFNPFDSGTNYNMTISAESGAGKSFFSNEMISAMLAQGGKVWVVDVGRSYMKLCETLGGQFLSFEQNSNICLNPFSAIASEEDFNEVQDILLNLLATMAAPQAGLDDFQTAQLRLILREQYLEHREALALDHIIAACFTRAADLGEGENKEFREKRISDVGFGLEAFGSKGQYGRYFTGPANIDFNRNFVLLELEELKSQKHLQTVVLLLLIFQIQNGMYLGDRGIKKLMLIDEAWDLLSDPKIAGFIEAGYRRFRKYNGAAAIITQALTDLHDSPTGRAVLANSACTIMLQQKPATLDRMASGDAPEFDKGLCERLKTVRTVPGKFSEVFIRSAYGQGIGRFVVDPFRALLYSTKPSDVAEIERFTKQGMAIHDAINAVLDARGVARG